MLTFAFCGSGSTLIDKFERFELEADLKNGTPREARLGRWILLYGVLQVLSTLSVDVKSLKYTESVRYFLCTDLKRCPEWVTNGQAASLEAHQLRSWCWQRSWDPESVPNGPAELEGSSTSASEELDSTIIDGATLLQNDIRRIGEKIDGLGISREESRLDAHRELEIRRDNEKVMQGEFSTKTIDNSYRLTESDFNQRPIIPTRNPLRSRSGSSAQTSYSGSPNVEQVNAPYGYVPSPPQVFPMQPQEREHYQDDKGEWR